MLKFILKRILETVITLFAVSLMTFLMVSLAPGDPFSSEKAPDPETHKKILEHYHLDKPILVQYGYYMFNVVFKGDFGPSLKHSNRSVNEIVESAFPVSLELGFYALLFALAIGLTAGIIASLKPNSPTDYVPMSLAMVGICVPTFVIGPLLALVFGLWLGWFEVAGWNSAADKVLPSFTLGAAYAAYIARLTRGGMLEIVNQDFIRTARAKGVPEFQVILKHALKGGLLPVISFLGPAVAGLLCGSFVVETIFAVPGLGQHFVAAAQNRDLFMVMGTVLLFATLIIVLNTIVDIVLVWLNPKQRLES